MKKVMPTSAPWQSHSVSMSDNTLVITGPHPSGAGYERICVVREGVDRDYSDEDYRAQANAQLMAAAPELLDAVKMVQEQLLSHMEGEWPGTMSITARRVTDVLRAAVTKAEGR